jgi:hypothetical protein
MRRFSIIVVGLAIGCGTSSSPTRPATATATTATTLTVHSLAISGVPSAFPAGTVVQLVATATMSDGTTQGVTRQTTWQSSNQGTATVATDPTTGGLVTGVAPGQTDIQATYQGSTATVHVTIDQPSRFAVTVFFHSTDTVHTPQQLGGLDVNVAGTRPATFGQNPFPSPGAPNGVWMVSPQWFCRAPIAVQVPDGLMRLSTKSGPPVMAKFGPPSVNGRLSSSAALNTYQ